MSALLAVRGLRVPLGGRTVVDGVDLAVGEGEMVGLIGPNGAGKTTLLRAAAGLLAPSAGEIAVAGRPIGRHPRRALARLLAYLPQGGDCHWPVTAARVVALGRLPHLGPWRRPSPADDAAIRRALAAADVGHLAGRRVDALSAGERTRVMLARALATEPRLLLADEPVAALDPYHQLHVMELLRRRAAAGAGVLVVLHDLALAARFCDRLVLMRAGRRLAEGPPETVLTAARLAEAYAVEAAYGRRDGAMYLVPWRRLDGAPAEDRE